MHHGTDVLLTEYWNYSSMHNRVMLTAFVGFCAAIIPACAGSETEELLAAAREGKYLCLTPDPSLGCQSYSRYKIEGNRIQDWSEVIVATNPPVVALFSTSQIAPDAEACWINADSKILEGPTFYRGGQLLPEIERIMFEDNFNRMIETDFSNGKRVCAVFSDGPKGRMVTYSYDGKAPEDPPVYFSYHTREDLPPLALGVTSVLLAR